MIKGRQNITTVQRITWIGLIVNLGLSLLKFTVGFLGASSAVIADAVHSISDMTTDLAVLFGVKFWAAPADQSHPFGHRRIETLITAFIGFALMIVALDIGYNSISTLQGAELKQPGWIAIIGPIVSIIFKELLYRSTVAVGVHVKSYAVIANAWHHRSDALSSIPALLAVTAAVINPSWAFIDPIGALVISIFILKVSWNIIVPALSELADHSASQRDCQKIRSIVMNINGVKSVHAIRTRKLGPGLHVDLHILVDGEMTVRRGHSIAEIAKKKLIKKGPEIFDVVVHLEPYNQQKIHIK